MGGIERSEMNYLTSGKVSSFPPVSCSTGLILTNDHSSIIDSADFSLDALCSWTDSPNGTIH